MGSLDAIRLKAAALCLVACKREALWSKRDTSEVSAKSTPMLKSAFPAGSCIRVTLMSYTPSGPGGEYYVNPVRRRKLALRQDKDMYSNKTAWQEQYRAGRTG
ncbi:hypothetical protein TIFTF001_006942 [Ficus carica]|uniref:Uncharacterized protein n=1 Tax=Ficus carica TaxID=3494 RepID=A0AA87ZS84_FICCA|nr:hypothetical protein TIFTF001_006942 [Ficus carica]